MNIDKTTSELSTPSEQKLQNEFEKRIKEIIETEDWNSITSKFDQHGKYSSLVAINNYLAKYMPDDDLYYALMRAYLRNSTAFCDKDINKMRALRPNNYLEKMPEEYKKQNPLTIYRASVTRPENIQQLQHEYSWAFKYEIAGWYLVNGEARTDKTHYIYRARIDQNDIIAYSSSHGIDEIIQLCGLKDVEHVPIPIDERIKLADNTLLMYAVFLERIIESNGDVAFLQPHLLPTLQNLTGQSML